MINKNTIISPRLVTIKYSLALLTLIIFLIASLFTSIKQIEKNDDDAKMINLSGRQRMLSQRIALLVSQLNKENFLLSVQKLQENLDLMRESHIKLIDFVNNSRSTVKIKKIKNILFGDHMLDLRVKEYLNLNQGIIDYFESGKSVRDLDVSKSKVISIAKSKILKDLDSVVNLLEQNSNLKISKTKKTQYLIFAIILLVIMAETLFIFKPLTKNIQNSFKILKEKNSEMEQFSYHLSKVIHVPLMTTQSFVELTDNDIKLKNYNDAKENLGRLKRNLDNFEVMLSNIAEVVNSDQLENLREPINLKQLVNEIINKVAPNPSVDIKIQNKVQDMPPLNLVRSRISFILSQLVHNAINFADKNKPISFVDIIAHQEDHNLILKINDNGIGIPKEFHKDIFGMFKRFNTSLAEGSGLGLYIVKKHLDKMNAQISFTTSNAGTEVTIKIPFV